MAAAGKIGIGDAWSDLCEANMESRAGYCDKAAWRRQEHAKPTLFLPSLRLESGFQRRIQIILSISIHIRQGYIYRRDSFELWILTLHGLTCNFEKTINYDASGLFNGAKENSMNSLMIFRWKSIETRYAKGWHVLCFRGERFSNDDKARSVEARRGKRIDRARLS